MTKLLLLCAIAMSLVTACSTDLTKAGSNVRLLNSAAEASKCQVIKTIFATARFGANNATKEAMNQAADAGANAFFIVSTTEDSESNKTSIVGNALMCK